MEIPKSVASHLTSAVKHVDYGPKAARQTVQSVPQDDRAQCKNDKKKHELFNKTIIRHNPTPTLWPKGCESSSSQYVVLASAAEEGIWSIF